MGRCRPSDKVKEIAEYTWWYRGGPAGSYLGSDGADGTDTRARAVRTLSRLGPIPGIAGRSPSYIVRQLYDFKYGTRAGNSSALMKASVEKLAVEDMLALAAYAASLAP
jgi:hypothetical protein